MNAGGLRGVIGDVNIDEVLRHPLDFQSRLVAKGPCLHAGLGKNGMRHKEGKARYGAHVT